MQGMPHPRRDLYPESPRSGYTPYASVIEASRGCPYDCEFCTIGTIAGRKYRSRPIDEVIVEINSIECPYLFFVDDSIALNRKNGRELFSEMKGLNKLWVGQGTATLAEDTTLLKLMYESGCRALLIGFESVQQNAGGGMKKITSLQINFKEAMQRFHDNGIAILGSFVFGFDHENKDVFKQTLEFGLKSKIDGFQLRILIPFPGTRLYARLIEEGRLLAPEWWRRGFSTNMLLFKPKGMSIDDYLEGYKYLSKHAYSYSAIIKRFFGISLSKRTAIGVRLYAGFNIGTRRRYMSNLNFPQPFAGADG
jgi:radical SAM superfamily enzyme YgiQ (UPF0313 family)